MSVNLLLIDLSSIAHPLFHVSASDPDPNATSIKTVERVRALASGQPHVAIACDCGRSFRKDLSPDYKANRPEHDATLQHQINLAIDTLKADGFPVWEAKGYEADDIIGTAVRRALEQESDARSSDATEYDLTVTVATQDKDLMQLIGPHVTVHALTNGTHYDADAVTAKYGVTPNQIVDFLTLTGDTSDNVKGAKGIGPKIAAGLLQKYGNLDDLYDAVINNGTQFTPALATSLREFKARMELTRNLIRLKTDVPIPFDDIWKPRVPADADAEFDDIAFAMPTLDENRSTDGDVLLDPSRQHSRTERDRVLAPRSDGRGIAMDGHQSEVSNLVAGSEPADSHSAPTAPVPPAATERAANPSAPNGGDSEHSVTLVPAPVPYERQLEPQTLRECYVLAGELFKSRLFSAYGTPQGILSTIIAARELGLPVATGLRLFFIIDGKPAMSADMIRGLVQRSPLCEYFRCKERSASRAVFVTKRKGDDEPTELAFTIEQGRAAWTKDQKAWDASAWGKRPTNMVTKSASSELARLVYADVVGNMYSVEELSGEERT
jgi:5'-3' exonuclease